MSYRVRIFLYAVLACALIAGALTLRSGVHASASPQAATPEAASPPATSTPTASPQAASAALQGDPAHPAHAEHWIETRLYFGLGPADAPRQGSSEADWRDFLDREVTPRFPSGLSVVDVYGQWQGQPQAGAGDAPSRIRSKMLIIDHPSTPEDAARIEAIRAAWKQRTHQHSVLEVSEPAEVSF
jgi:hypothetical protein